MFLRYEAGFIVYSLAIFQSLFKWAGSYEKDAKVVFQALLGNQCFRTKLLGLHAIIPVLKRYPLA